MKMKKLLKFVLLWSALFTPVSAQTLLENLSQIYGVSESLPYWEQGMVVMTRMYRQAPARVNTLDVESIVQNEPEFPVWALCSASTIFYESLVSPHGYTVSLVELFAYLTPEYTAAHVVVEVSGPGLAEPITVDPLYGRVFSDGTALLSMREILEDPLAVQVIRVDGVESAVDPVFEDFNLLDYSVILRKYFKGVAFISADHKEWLLLIRDSSRIDSVWALETYPTKKIQVYRLEP